MLKKQLKNLTSLVLECFLQWECRRQVDESDARGRRLLDDYMSSGKMQPGSQSVPGAGGES